MKRYQYVRPTEVKPYDTLCNWCGERCVGEYAILTMYNDTLSMNSHLCSRCYETLITMFCLRPLSNEEDGHIVNYDDVEKVFGHTDKKPIFGEFP